MVFPVPLSLKTLASLSYRNSRQLSMNAVISLLHWVRESTVVQEAVDRPTPGSQRPSERQPTAPFLHLLVSQQSFTSPRLPQENRTSGGSKRSPFDLGSNTCWLSDLGHISLTTLHYSSLSAKWGMLGNCSIQSRVYDNYHSHVRCWLSLRVSSTVRAPVSTCSSTK